MRAYNCDRCGKTFVWYNSQATGHSFGITRNPFGFGDCLDLCPSCNDELHDWIKNGKEQAVSIQKED